MEIGGKFSLACKMNRDVETSYLLRPGHSQAGGDDLERGILFDLLSLWGRAEDLGKRKSLSCVQLFVTPRTVARQAPLSMQFSRQEYWSG